MKRFLTILGISAISMGAALHVQAQAQQETPKIQENQKSQEAPKTIEKKEFYEIFIKDHKFTPETITVPAGQKIKLIIHNQDPTPEEFESYDLNREKIILGNKKATIFVGPLKAGKYHYFGEFNMDTANGYIIAE